MSFPLSWCEQNYSQFLVLVGGHQHRSALVLHEEHDELRRFGLACVPPNDVDIIRAFVEGLTRRQRRFLSASHLHHDRAFQHINKIIGIVAMYWVRTAGRIFHADHQTFFARKAGQGLRQQLRYLSLLFHFTDAISMRCVCWSSPLRVVPHEPADLRCRGRQAGHATEFLDLNRREKVLWHVSAPGKGWLEFL